MKRKMYITLSAIFFAGSLVAQTSSTSTMSTSVVPQTDSKQTTTVTTTDQHGVSSGKKTTVNDFEVFQPVIKEIGELTASKQTSSKDMIISIDKQLADANFRYKELLNKELANKDLSKHDKKIIEAELLKLK
jgi:uncharacterized protein YgfB (UPF0149 family)